MEIDIIKKLCSWLFDPFLKGVGFLKGIIDGDEEKKIVIAEAEETITLTKDQFDKLVNGAIQSAEKAKEEKKEEKGFFGKVFGWIVDHFWGLVKILAVVAVGWLFLFRGKWLLGKLEALRQWIVDWLSGIFSNENKAREEAGKAIVGKDTHEASQKRAEEPEKVENHTKEYRLQARDDRVGATSIEDSFHMNDGNPLYWGLRNDTEPNASLARAQAEYLDKAAAFLEEWAKDHNGVMPDAGKGPGVGMKSELLCAAGPEGKKIVDEYNKKREEILRKYYKEEKERSKPLIENPKEVDKDVPGAQAEFGQTTPNTGVRQEYRSDNPPDTWRNFNYGTMDPGTGMML